MGRLGLIFVLLLAAWHANIEAAPIHSEADSANLGEASKQARENIPEPKEPENPTPSQAAAKTSVDASKRKVEQALAAVNGGSVPNSVRTPVVNVAKPAGVDNIQDPYDAQPDTVKPPTIPTPDSYVFNEPTLVKPPPEKYINRNLKPGDEGYFHQQAEDPIMTATHTLHHIEVKLQKNRDIRYNEARGAHNVYLAAQSGAAATADMANAVKEQQESDFSEIEQHMRQVKEKIAEVQGRNNPAHAKLNLQLERLKRKKAETEARAKTLGEAVDKAINKAGEIMGRARAVAAEQMDPHMELEHAIVANAKAQMALEEHDKQTKLENQQERSDQKKRDYFSKVDEQSTAAYQKLKDDSVANEDKFREHMHQQEIQEAKRVMAQVERVGTVMTTQDIEKVPSFDKSPRDAEPRPSSTKGSSRSSAEQLVADAKAKANAVGANTGD